MRERITLSLALLLCLCFLISCSGGSYDGISPAINDKPQAADTSGTTTCLALWQVVIDTETCRADIADLRAADQMLNVLGFLEPPTMTGLSIDFGTLQIKPGQKYVGVDVILKHPLASAMFLGFDVRGVVFGPEVTNADGLTIVLSPEFFTGVTFGYKDGLLGVPDSAIHYTGLAGYKYFCKDIGLNDKLSDFFSDPGNVANRGVFPNGAQVRRHYDLSWKNSEPPVNFMVFNYAVYANYSWPVGTPPYDKDDFDILTANSAEAFCASVTEISNSLWYYEGKGGGNISLHVEAWDWQEDIDEVTIESGSVIAKTAGSYFGTGGTDKSLVYSFDSVPGTPTASGEITILITSVDPKTFGQSWFSNLLPKNNPLYYTQVYNCWVYKTQVSPTPPPCADMEPFSAYEASTISGDPWLYLLPEDAGVVCTRDTSQAIFIISAALHDYPGPTYYTFGASLATSADPLIPDVMYNKFYWITTGIACDSNNNIYLVKNNDPDPPDTLAKTYFDGSSFTEPTDEHTFPGTIVRITVDKNDNPIALVENNVGSGYTIYHKLSDVWVPIPVNSTIVSAGIKDFAYNPIKGHYVFVCVTIPIKLFAMDAAGNIQFTDDELFGTQPISWTPSIYIDQDDPNCHIVTWGVLDSSNSYARPTARYAAYDYTIPKVMGSLTSSTNGASKIGGAWAPGTSYMFIPAYDTDYKEGLGRITVPSDW